MVLAHGKCVEAARVRELGSSEDFLQSLPGRKNAKDFPLLNN